MAARRRTRTNKKVDVPAHFRAKREWAGGAVPTSVQWILNNPKRVRERFTELQWAVLVTRNPRCHCGAFHVGQISSKVVGEILGYTKRSRQLRKAENAAERLAYELFYLWLPTVEKWQRIRSGHPRIINDHPETLDAYEKRLLDKHRKTKKGRRPTEIPERIPLPSGDVLDTWKNVHGETMSHATRFADLYNSQRRAMGLPEEDES